MHIDSLSVTVAVKLRSTPFCGGSGLIVMLTILAGSEELAVYNIMLHII